MCCAPQTHHQALPATWCDKGKRDLPCFTQQEESLQSACTQTRDPWSVIIFDSQWNWKLCYNKVLPFPWITFSGAPPLEDTRMFWDSTCSESNNSHFLGSTSSIQCKLRSCRLTTAKKVGVFFCRNQQGSFEMIVFCINILDSPHPHKSWCLTSSWLFKALKNVTGSETLVSWTEFSVAL